MTTRILYLFAAAATAGALILPMWGFTMSAPQYPDESLHLRVERVGITGDVHEIQTLQHYVGVEFPTDLPEVQWAVRGIALLAVLLAAGAFVGSGRAGRWYRVSCAALLVSFLALSAGAVQVRLYRVGHERDPNAPISALGDFTPPLIGPVKVANFTVWSYPHVGGALLLVASILAVIGARVRSGEPRTRGRVARRAGALARKEAA